MFPSIAHTEHRVRSLRRVVGRPNVPPPPDPFTRDLAGKYRDPATSQVILQGSNSAGSQNLSPGNSTLGTLLPTRSPRSESLPPVEQPSSCETGHNARLATKGSVQQSSVDPPVYSEHAPVMPGPGNWCSVPPNTPGKQGTVTTSGRPITPGLPGSTVTPGDSVRPVHSGQKAQLEKADQCLDQSELSVLNSPCRSVQLEHNVHEQPGDMPNLQIEHLSELRSAIEHWSAFLETDIIMMLLVHHGGITAHIVQLFSFVTLTQVNLFGLRCSGIVSGFVLLLTTLSFRDIIVVSSLAQESRRSHKKRKFSSTSSPSSHPFSFSSFRERERKWYMSKEETH